METLIVPTGSHVRFDTLLYDGYSVPPLYDSLLGKLIVHGGTREECLSRLFDALAALSIEGIPTTVPLHRALAADSDVAAGNIHTRFLEGWLENRFAAQSGDKEVA